MQPVKKISANAEKRLKQAEQFCQNTGARFTPIRRTILALMYAHQEYLTAYELLHLLREKNPKVEAMTVYRALDFLQAQKLIHRIASQNAYATCDTPHHAHHTYFLLCERCQQTQEVDIQSLNKVFKLITKQYDFFLSDKPVEIIGVCKNCRRENP
ncbi:MAG: transcriptional repressor [Proteobacteria bacterium]|nr:transcriptional repressor [Pseudomonadota bacterium]